jgi:hypothetical protein
MHNAFHGPLSGVIVTGVWSNGAGSASCTTGSNGTCSIQKTKLSRSAVASLSFTVTAATKPGWTYTPSANHDPDGSRDGTVIVILRPG